MGAYYTNSLKAKRTELLKELRLSMARYGRLERQGHPSKIDQGKYIDLTKQMLSLVDAELAEAGIADAREKFLDAMSQ